MKSLIVVAIAVVGVCAGAASGAPSRSSGFRTAAVDGVMLRRKTLAAALTALKRANCSLGKVRRAYSARVPRGRIVSHSPAAGARRPSGARVHVVVSRGKHA